MKDLWCAWVAGSGHADGPGAGAGLRGISAVGLTGRERGRELGLRRHRSDDCGQVPQSGQDHEQQTVAGRQPRYQVPGRHARARSSATASLRPAARLRLPSQRRLPSSTAVYASVGKVRSASDNHTSFRLTCRTSGHLRAGCAGHKPSEVSSPVKSAARRPLRSSYQPVTQLRRSVILGSSSP